MSVRQFRCSICIFPDSPDFRLGIVTHRRIFLLQGKFKMKRKKITVLHVFSGDLWAGAEVMIFTLLNRLRDYSEIRVLALSLNEGVLTNKLREVGVKTFVIPEKFNTFPQILMKSIKLFKEEKIDIVHSHRFKENLLAFLLVRSMKNVKIITTIHGLSEQDYAGINVNFFGRWKKRIHFLILKYFFDRIIAVSQDIKKILMKDAFFSPSTTEVIHNGIDISNIKKNINDETKIQKGYFYIGTVGRMVPVKGFDLYLDLAAEIRKKTDNVRFSILGDGPRKEHLILKAKELKIENAVDFLSACPNPEQYYNSLDLYINTSFHEGMPLSILEAMAYGKAVVAPNVGGIPEIISNGENGMLIEDRNVEGFVDACLKIIHNANLKSWLESKASKTIEAFFNDERMTCNYVDVYKNLLY